MFKSSAFLPLALGIVAQTSAATIDPVFAGFTATMPGCAVGVETADGAVITRAYGSADLEHGIANTPDTVFEAGSVSKQFTAAAIVLLAEDGKLALSDDVHRYLPELPDYGTPITIADLLSHTSGLRDWGEIEDLAGWARGERIYSLKDVLEIAASQKRLNYRPGTDWSYTNTGYNLTAIIVERVSGRSLAAFTHDRLFVPLGMTHTRWRDDFRRIEKGRAIAYSQQGGAAFEQDMPFENAIGNGGLLTTVGDLLIWNRALANDKIGKDVAHTLETQATLRDGQLIGYGKGLFLQRYLGREEIAHSGSTAGYRAWLGRYPAQKLSVALLCNDGNVDSTAIGHAIAARYLPSPPAPTPLSPAEKKRLASYAGWYVEDRSGAPLHLVLSAGTLVGGDGRPVERGVDGGYRIGTKPIGFLPDGTVTLTEVGLPAHYSRSTAFVPDAATLDRLVGRYRNADANVVYRLERRGSELHLRVEGRPDRDDRLVPAYANTFTFDGKLAKVMLRPDKTIAALEVTGGRVWRLRFDRIG